MQTVYHKYRDRLVEISGKSRALYTKNVNKKYSFDLAELITTSSKTEEFTAFLWRKNNILSLFKDGIKTEEETKAFSELKFLSREVDDFFAETGKFDLYVGYPYVVGKVGDIHLRAPLLFFPIKIDVECENIFLQTNENSPILYNKSLFLAYYSQIKKKNDGFSEEFDPNDYMVGDIQEITENLRKQGFSFTCNKRKALCRYEFDAVEENGSPTIKNTALVGRFPLTTPLYEDYTALEQKNMSSPSVSLLLKGKPDKKPLKPKLILKQKKSDSETYFSIGNIDYSQKKAMEAVTKQDNVVIFGPPGTGKSQTIVNIIGDAIAKNKKILVVSQKKAALDVVFSRLAKLNDKAMIIADPENGKSDFFSRARSMHARAQASDGTQQMHRLEQTEKELLKEKETLRVIEETLFTKTEFGLTLQEMYEKSHCIGADDDDNILYEKLARTCIFDENYTDLSEDINNIRTKKLLKTYFDYRLATENNPLVFHIRDDLDIHDEKDVLSVLTELTTKPLCSFPFDEYPFSRFLLPFFLERNKKEKRDLESVADLIARDLYPALRRKIKFSSFFPFLFFYPFFKKQYDVKRNEILISLNTALKPINDVEKKYAVLKKALDNNGYAFALENILNGNTEYLKKLLEAVQNYPFIRDTTKVIRALDDKQIEILRFCYENSSQNARDMEKILEKIIPIRIYHEIKTRQDSTEILSQTSSFDDFRERVGVLMKQKKTLCEEITRIKSDASYLSYFEKNASKGKDYLFQIGKQKNLWSIRRMMDCFSDFLLELFPCYLMSPQAVSAVFDLKQNLFDIVIFDEASQVFIENAIPSLFRGQKTVIAGDNKQLRPSGTFIKRYQAEENDPSLDLSTQTALEVESLLDLASVKFAPIRLQYHYRSMYEELIDFSNAAFYDNSLRIAPNVYLRSDAKPIERIKVRGYRENRQNKEEAVAVVKLIKRILTERTQNESVGVVTFNVEQKECIEETLDEESIKQKSFRTQIFRERNRYENGENRSLFIKNLENVQGDERDIIIFSIGYARSRNSERIYTQFGALSQEGGENRLNVAITRAKKKIYIVTSIEPEELPGIDETKNNGPKLLQKYLSYARAVSEDNEKEISRILSSFPSAEKEQPFCLTSAENDLKNRLIAAGYEIHENVGHTACRIALAVFERRINRFLLGIEFDRRAYENGENPEEREIFRPFFLESKGWKILRVWSHDYWKSPASVLKKIEKAIESERNKLM